MAQGVAAATCSMTASWSAGMIAASGPVDAPESGPGSRPRFAELVARPSNDFRSSRIDEDDRGKAEHEKPNAFDGKSKQVASEQDLGGGCGDRHAQIPRRTTAASRKRAPTELAARPAALTAWPAGELAISRHSWLTVVTG